MRSTNTLNQGVLAATISFLVLIALLLVAAGCGSAPKMERPITIYNGAPEKDGICRANHEKLRQLLPELKNVPDAILRLAVKDIQGEECISATDERFKKFAALTFDDLGVYARYVETLIYSCNQWK